MRHRFHLLARVPGPERASQRGSGDGGCHNTATKKERSAHSQPKPKQGCRAPPPGHTAGPDSAHTRLGVHRPGTKLLPTKLESHRRIIQELPA